MYATGRGVAQDDAEAAWYRKAAEQCHADAKYNLGFMHFYGRGVLQDYVLAHMWPRHSAWRESGSQWRNDSEPEDDLI
jgi:uncharacterized protein